MFYLAKLRGHSPYITGKHFFGTTKGRYTGAQGKPGIFEIANGGTIFLDEINSMDLGMQAKLLKAIDEKQIMRIGGFECKKVDVRIIAAINETPETCTINNRMRNDHFFKDFPAYR